MDGQWILCCCVLDKRACRSATVGGQSPLRHRRRRVIAITGGKLLTVSHGLIENGVLVMSDGKITAVGENGKVKVPDWCDDRGCEGDDGVSGTDRSGDEARVDGSERGPDDE